MRLTTYIPDAQADASNRNRAPLHKDGEPGIEEREFVRQKAPREVEQMMVDILTQASTNIISRSPWSALPFQPPPKE